MRVRQGINENKQLISIKMKKVDDFITKSGQVDNSG